jgi:MYXO-CTERM domain-containing protein
MIRWLAVLSVLAVATPVFGQQKAGWTLTFDDEFDETSLDTTKWGTYYKWGQAVINGELEAYVPDAFTFSNGIMTINGTNTPGSYAGQTMSYSSGLIASVLEQQYGYFEMRAKLPAGQGLWPAFWLLHGNSTPDIAEVDIFEVLGNAPTTVYSTVHWGTNYAIPADSFSDQVVSTEPDTSADFHIYGLEWDVDKLVWYFDGTAIHTYTGVGVPKVPMYLIANLAIGGTWPGSPNSSTVFPAELQIDYVRAYEASADGGGSSSSSSSTSTSSSGGYSSSSLSSGASPSTSASSTAPPSSGSSTSSSWTGATSSAGNLSASSSTGAPATTGSSGTWVSGSSSSGVTASGASSTSTLGSGSSSSDSLGTSSSGAIVDGSGGAGTGAGGGAGAAANPGGCGCRVSSTDAANGRAILLAFGLLGLLRHRRANCATRPRLGGK